MSTFEVTYVGDVQHNRDVLNPAPRLRLYRDGDYFVAVDCLVTRPSIQFDIRPELPATSDDQIRWGLARFVAKGLERFVESGDLGQSADRTTTVGVTDRPKTEAVDLVLPIEGLIEVLREHQGQLNEGALVHSFDADPVSEAKALTPDELYVPFPPFKEFSVVVDAGVWTSASSFLGDERSRAGDQAADDALRYALRLAAVDTGAIENLYETDRGLTQTIASAATAWESIAVQNQGVDVADLIRAQLNAYELALDVATGAQPITEALIRRLHEEVCASQQTYKVRTAVGPQEHELPKGEYKRHPNHVELPDGTIHAYAPVLDTPPEMARLVRELGTPDFTGAHPVAQSAYVHFAMTVVHPFADGNGRVARLLASIFLLRATSLPFVLFADQKTEYLDALEQADSGRFQPFADVVFHRAIDTIQLVIELLKLSRAPAVEGSADRLRAILTTHGGLTHQEMDGVGNRLFDVIVGLLQEGFEGIQLPPGISRDINITSEGRPTREGYRPILENGPRVVRVNAQSAPPADASVTRRFRVLVGVTDEFSELLLERVDDGEVVGIDLREAHPSVSETLLLRVRMVIERTIAELLQELGEQAEQSLRNKGYG